MTAKYLSAGSMAYNPATRTLDGGTITPAFDSTDVGRALAFLMGTTVYYGRIYSVTDGNTIALEQGSGIPAGAGTVTQLLEPDQGERHSYSSYTAEIARMLQDGAAKLDAANVESCLEAAVTGYAEDEPLLVKKAVTGNGTKIYPLAAALGSLWVPGHTRISSIEYPAGADPPETLEQDTEFAIYDDGTAQDGSNLALRFVDDAPAASESFIVTIAPELSLPQIGTQNFPDTDRTFRAITLLASVYACERLAAAYAQSTDATITADVVNYHDKSSKYMSLAKQYRSEYNLLVFGATEPPSSVKAAIVEKQITTQTALNTPYLFHRRGR